MTDLLIIFTETVKWPAHVVFGPTKIMNQFDFLSNESGSATSNHNEEFYFRFFKCHIMFKSPINKEFVDTSLFSGAHL